nr:MAG TPA: hypothetical protein [Caudoviricetes sp.]
MNDRKRTVSEFGIAVKIKLIKMNKTQNWLIEEIKKRNPTMFVDSSVLYKVLTGQIVSGKIVDAIKTVLGISG